MLDGRSLDVISKFKLALLTRKHNPAVHTNLPASNRGRKSASSDKSSALTPKIVEYNGTNRLVLTNDAIERSNYRNKRRWLDFYSSGKQQDGTSSETEFSDDEDDSDDCAERDESPLKKLRLSEILAPLAHPSEVATHPAILKTYKLTCLATLASDLINSIEVEQTTLNQFNKLLQILDGEDWFYQLEENMDLPLYDHGLDDSLASDGTSVESRRNVEVLQNGARKGAGPETDADGASYKRITRGASAEEGIRITDPFFALPKSLALFEHQQRKQLEEDDEKNDDPLEVLKQDLRNYLQVSIQRQHECKKNLMTIRNGIVKADKYKRDLYRWGKEISEKK
ncbi:hypothetical protein METBISCDRAFT_13496 [Metschnikowia bicuspidata]|uniref:Transcriptional regulatory protein RXT2 N-terminal domain-containing protein n=1 Tax=Metschnikowia bicuspidata TaxID=27322 RepID=A0A4P9ZGV9_9ASCO|nr:hypothetical protein METBISCDRAFT_13496 [Metschnikowia bicuspidata]